MQPEAMYANQRAHESFKISLQTRGFKNESSVHKLETRSNTEVLIKGKGHQPYNLEKKFVNHIDWKRFINHESRKKDSQPRRRETKVINPKGQKRFTNPEDRKKVPQP